MRKNIAALVLSLYSLTSSSNASSDFLPYLQDKPQIVSSISQQARINSDKKQLTWQQLEEIKLVLADFHLGEYISGFDPKKTHEISARKVNDRSYELNFFFGGQSYTLYASDSFPADNKVSWVELTWKEKSTKMIMLYPANSNPQNLKPISLSSAEAFYGALERILK